MLAHDRDGGTPVVYGDLPSYNNLVGRVEHRANMGALETDFTMIRPGALHRANLMLRRDVVAAVEQGLFSVHPVGTVDEGIAILTGMPAGERGDDGRFPPDSVNGRVEARLIGFAERLQALRAGRRADGDGVGGDPPTR